MTINLAQSAVDYHLKRLFEELEFQAIGGVTTRAEIMRALEQYNLADPWLDHLVVDFDEDRHWIVLRRNRLAIACNLGAEATTVPVSGELVLAWATPTCNGETTDLPAHSFAILRLPREQT